MTRTVPGPRRTALVTVWAVGVLVGVGGAVLTSDVIVGVIAGAAGVVIGNGLLRLWTGGGSPRSPRP